MLPMVDRYRFFDFPSFSEGLSLRHYKPFGVESKPEFPFLFGGTFIEAWGSRASSIWEGGFPFLFGGTFIEAAHLRRADSRQS